MKYNLNNPIDRAKFKKRVNEFYEQKEFVELKKVQAPRSNAQNSYLHLILGWFSVEYGVDMEYTKQEIFKKQACKDIFYADFVNRNTGEVYKSWRSTRSLDKLEMTQAIDKFRTYSAQHFDIYIPEHNEKEFLKHVQIEMDRQKEYL